MRQLRGHSRYQIFDLTWAVHGYFSLSYNQLQAFFTWLAMEQFVCYEVVTPALLVLYFNQMMAQSGLFKVLNDFVNI